MQDLDRIEYVCREIERGIVSHDYIKALLAYARRALRVERGMEKYHVRTEWNRGNPEFEGDIAGVDHWRVSGATAYESAVVRHEEWQSAVLALLDKLEPEAPDGR